MPRDLRDRLLAYPLCKHRRDRIVPQRVYMKFSAESIPVVEPPQPVCERGGVRSRTILIDKQQRILEAEGEAQAILAVQKANADAIRLLNEAMPTDKVLDLRSLEALAKVAHGKATKIIIPSEIQGLAGLCASAKAVFDSVEPNKPKPSAESK